MVMKEEGFRGLSPYEVNRHHATVSSPRALRGRRRRRPATLANTTPAKPPRRRPPPIRSPWIAKPKRLVRMWLRKSAGVWAGRFTTMSYSNGSRWNTVCALVCWRAWTRSVRVGSWRAWRHFLSSSAHRRDGRYVHHLTQAILSLGGAHGGCVIVASSALACCCRRQPPCASASWLVEDRVAIVALPPRLVEATTRSDGWKRPTANASYRFRKGPFSKKTRRIRAPDTICSSTSRVGR